MRKFVLILLTILFVVGTRIPAEAAGRGRVVRSAVNTVTKSLAKAGDGLSSFFWRNKVAITTGAILVTAASHPEAIIDGAATALAGPPILVQNPDAALRKIRPFADFGGSVFLAGLIVVLFLVLLYESGGRARIAAKLIGTVLLIALVVFCCGVARAGVPGTEINTILAAGRSLWGFLLEIVLILLTLGVPFT